MENNSNDMFSKLLIFSTTSTLFLSLAILSYIIFNDQFLYIISQIVNSGTGVWLPDWPATIIDTFAEGFSVFIGVCDKLWLISFLAMAMGIIVEQYKLRRRGYFEIMSLLSFGIMAFLFIFSIWNQITQWLYNVFFNGILQNITVQVPFFNLYIENLTLINLSIIVISILVNFIDFDFIKYNNRKQKELSNDEL